MEMRTRVPSFLFVFGVMEYFDSDQPAFIKYPMVSYFICISFLLIAIEILVQSMFQLLNEEQRKTYQCS
jgi:hypothetical protein